jgi:formate-dependent nitrite reductase cytochrome c552 subunit
MDLQEKEETLPHLVVEVNRLKAEKKDVAKEYKEQIDGKETQIAILAQEIEFAKLNNGY